MSQTRLRPELLVSPSQPGSLEWSWEGPRTGGSPHQGSETARVLGAAVLPLPSMRQEPRLKVLPQQKQNAGPTLETATIREGLFFREDRSPQSRRLHEESTPHPLMGAADLLPSDKGGNECFQT